MSIRTAVLFVIISILAFIGLQLHGLAQDTKPAPPAWAYPIKSADEKRPVDDGKPLSVPGGKGNWTAAQAADLFVVPDWHPDEHPPLPDSVGKGRKPDAYPCAHCHRADGPGGPENASLAGLPKDYILQQMADFKSGGRYGSVPERVPTTLMIKVAKTATEAETEAAAEYFSHLKPRKTITVIETDSVPRSRNSGWIFAAVEGAETEPLGNRILEVPRNLAQFEARDTHSEFIAYVPKGSLARGQALATTGDNGKTQKCSICHGPDLRGLAAFPGIAGRSPSYIFRQFYDMQRGTRKGAGSALMSPVVNKLTNEDMLDLAAYLASLHP